MSVGLGTVPSAGCVLGCDSDAEGKITTGAGGGGVRLRQPAPPSKITEAARAASIRASLWLGMDKWHRHPERFHP